MEQKLKGESKKEKIKYFSLCIMESAEFRVRIFKLFFSPLLYRIWCTSEE